MGEEHSPGGDFGDDERLVFEHFVIFEDRGLEEVAQEAVVLRRIVVVEAFLQNLEDLLVVSRFVG